MKILERETLAQEALVEIKPKYVVKERVEQDEWVKAQLKLRRLKKKNLKRKFFDNPSLLDRTLLSLAKEMRAGTNSDF